MIGRSIIGSRWVYKIKYNSNGDIERLKVGLFAKRHIQIEGFDYTETFSPVAKIVSVRTLLAVALIKNWHTFQMDVSNVFLHENLVKDIYMNPSLGMLLSDDNKVCKLKKSLYNLKEANKNWYKKLTNFLTSFGFKQSKVDCTLFFKQISSSYTCLLIYVDDHIISSDRIKETNKLKGHLHIEFHIKNLGKIKYFLGIEVSQFAPRDIHI